MLSFCFINNNNLNAYSEHTNFTYQRVLFWNSLSNDIINIHLFNKFKHFIRAFLLNKYNFFYVHVKKC